MVSYGFVVGYAEAAFPKGGDGVALVNEMKKILAEDVKSGVSSALVGAAKRHELTNAEFQKNSVSGLAMAWSQALAVEGRNSPDEDVKAIHDSKAFRYRGVSGIVLLLPE
jgi:zinc protease